MGKPFGDEAGFCWDSPVKIKVGRSAADKAEGRPKSSKPGFAPKSFKQAAAPSSYKLPEIGHSFSRYPQIAFDVESKDPNLRRLGPGYQRKDAFIVGWGICSRQWAGGYYPVRHKNAPNLDARIVAEWIADEMASYKGEVIGANLLYDGEAADSEMVTFANAIIRDVQWAAPLIDENMRKYNLDALSRKHLGKEKVKEQIVELYGPGFIENMDLVHPGHAEVYVMGDLHLPFELMDTMEPILRKDGTWDIFNMEARLYPFLLYLRKQGVRIDRPKAEQLSVRLKKMLEDANANMKSMVGWVPNVNASGDLAKAFEKLGIETPRTAPTQKNPNGLPSVTKYFLDACDHPFATQAKLAKNAGKFDGDFVDKWLRESFHDRLHCVFHPQKSDQGGTVSGRFSSSNPNLQQVPQRDEIFGPLIRGLFIPEDGCEWWSADYSQIEYRLLVHYAFITKRLGADKAAAMYRENPNMDFHALAAELTGKPRKTAKNINFGVVYGMGEEHMAHVMGVSRDVAKRILGEYHGEMPFAKAMLDMAAAKAKATGLIRDIGGRLAHFDLFEPGFYLKPGSSKWKDFLDAGHITKNAKGKLVIKAYPLAEAIAAYGTNVKRAHTHKALNRLLQASAATMNKKAMVNIWEAGLIGPGRPLIGHLTVHDELDGSKPKGNKLGDEAFEEVQRIMREAVPLSIPVLVGAAKGENWAEAH